MKNNLIKVSITVFLLFQTSLGIAYWLTPTGIPAGKVTDFDIDQNNLFCTSYSSNDIYKSNNNGATWTSAGPISNAFESFYSLTISGNYLIAGSSYSGPGSGILHRSTDYGNTWNGISNNPAVNTVYCLESDSNYIFAGFHYNGVYRSINFGQSWTAINTGLPLPGNQPQDLLQTEFGLFVCVPGLNYGIYKSIDHGNSWTHPTIGLTSKYIISLKYHGGKVYAGGYDGNIFFSSDSGNTWQSIGGNFTTKDIQCIAVNGKEIFVGTDGEGVFRSNDHGATWNSMNDSLPNLYINDLEISGTNLIAGHNNGISIFPSLICPVDYNSISVSACETYDSPSGNYTWTTDGIFSDTLSNINGCDSILAINLKIFQKPSSIIYASGSTTFCPGNSVTLSADQDTGITYTWKKYGNIIPGETDSTLLVGKTGKYKCILSNSGGCIVPSNVIEVNLLPLPSASISTSDPTSFCYGDSSLLVANSGAGYTYQWKRYGNLIAGATSQSFAAIKTGKYKCIVTNTFGCSRNSNPIFTSLLPLPTSSILANGPTSFCQGDSVVLIANSGTGYNYQWKKYNNLLSGETDSALVVNSTGKFKCIVTNSFGCSRASNAINTNIVCRNTIVGTSEGGISVFPNPSSGRINIEGPKGILQILNSQGLVVYYNTEFSNFITTLDLPYGVYTILIRTDNVTYKKQVIVL
jgi:photosystem II stability/assembly factor-like uncharacterized protein